MDNNQAPEKINGFEGNETTSMPTETTEPPVSEETASVPTEMTEAPATDEAIAEQAEATEEKKPRKRKALKIILKLKTLKTLQNYLVKS